MSVGWSVRLFVGLSVSFNKSTMPNKLLKELQAKFKTAERESKASEEGRLKIQPDLMEINEDSNKTIGVPPILAMQSSNNELTNLPQVSILKRKLQKQFKEASRDSKDEKENREKAFEPITRELVQIKEAVRGDSYPLPLSLPTPSPLPLPSPLQIAHPSIGPNGIGRIASKYIAHTDPKFGIWFDEDIAYIGDKKIVIDDNDIIINGQKFMGTEGLWALLSYPKGVPEELYDENDLENYRKIVISTNCMYANNDSSNNKAKSSVNAKWKKLLSPIWKDRMKKGSGILKYNENPVEYKYIGNGDDLNELKQRVDYLYAQEKAGNNNFHNEKLGILHFISEQLEKHIDNREGIENLRSIINTVINSHTGAGIFNSVLNNDFMPEMHLPGYNYCGPFTKLKKRLARGDKGINKLDEACKKHDIFYHDYKDTKARHSADKELQDAAHEILFDPDSSLKERGDALIVKAGMKSKRFFGMGLRKDAIFE